MFRVGNTLWSDAVFNFDIWKKLCKLAGTSVDLKRRIGWANTGVIAMPTKWVEHFTFQWIHQIDYLSLYIPEEDNFFLDTLAFIFAIDAFARSHGVPASDICFELPVQLNTQLNLPKYDMIRNGFLTSLNRQKSPLLIQYTQGTISVSSYGHFKQYTSDLVNVFPFLHCVNDKISELSITAYSAPTESRFSSKPNL